MSSIIKFWILALLLLLSMGIILGCGDRNPDAPEFNYERGEAEHPDNWLPAKHAAEAREELADCAECHGASFDGGIADVSCFECHLGSESDVHPLDWDDQEALLHRGYVESFGTEGCAIKYCHGRDLNGVKDSGPSCLTACHMGSADSFHPSEWDGYTYARHDNYVRDNGTAECSNVACHGADLEGVTGSGPYCSSCHIGDTVVDSTIVFSVHPSGWDSDSSLHGAYIASNGTSSCRNVVCHGSNLEGVTGSGASCNACHPF
jgi:hypothetical protein